MLGIAVMGSRDSIYGFASLGLTLFPVETKQEALSTLALIADGDYAIIYITEEIAEMISAQIAKYRDVPIPAIIPIPGMSGNTGIGMLSVRQSVEKAVGSDIIFNDN